MIVVNTLQFVIFAVLVILIIIHFKININSLLLSPYICRVHKILLIYLIKISSCYLINLIISRLGIAESGCYKVHLTICPYHCSGYSPLRNFLIAPKLVVVLISKTASSPMISRSMLAQAHGYAGFTMVKFMRWTFLSVSSMNSLATRSSR